MKQIPSDVEELTSKAALATGLDHSLENERPHMVISQTMHILIATDYLVLCFEIFK